LVPLPDSEPIERRAADLTRRMVLAKKHDLQLIRLANVYDPRTGILNADGSPRVLFLPWRTTSLALRGAKSLGSFSSIHGSKILVFEKEGDAILVLWNETPVTERLPLGPRVRQQDAWGHHSPLLPDSEDRVTVEVGPIPIFLTGISPGLVRFRLAVAFERGRVESAFGAQVDTLVLENPFSQGISGSVVLIPPQSWDFEPREFEFQIPKGETFRQPIRMELPANVGLGEHPVQINITLNADRPYRFELVRPYRVESSELELEVVTRWLPGDRLEIEQLLTNQTSPVREMSFNCYIMVPGRRRQKQVVTQLGDGVDRRFYFLTDANELIGREVWLRAEEIGGRRVLNYRWTITAPEPVDR